MTTTKKKPTAKKTPAKKQPTVPSEPYESNPINNLITGIKQLFTINRTPAIIILVLGILISIPQLTPDKTDTPTTATTNTVAQTAPAAGSHVSVSPVAVIAVLVGVLLIVGLAFVIGAFITGVINYIAYKTSKNEPTTFGEAVEITLQKFRTILYITIAVALKVLGGLLLFIAPGVRAAIRYQMVLLPFFDEDLTGKQALERTRNLTQGHLLEIFGIQAFAAMLIPFAPVLQIGGEAQMYRQLKALHASGKSGPPAHWLNYVPIVLLACVGMLAVLVYGFGL